MLIFSSSSFGVVMSAINNLPVNSTPGYITRPIFGRINVTVIAAFTDIPRGLPLSESSPEGISTDNFGVLKEFNFSSGSFHFLLEPGTKNCINNQITFFIV